MEGSRQKSGWKQFVTASIDSLSFNEKIRDLSDLLNRKLERIDDIQSLMFSHPGGFIRSFHKRRMGIAEAYLSIVRQADPSAYRDRLNALKTIVDLSFHAKTVSMPLNTARVQMQLMKEAVKNADDKRKQMEHLADFSLASYGHEAVIRRLLQEHGRIEVPETGQPLKELDLGWDSHVYDNLSEGRKTPSQLALDAFMKGMSRFTLAYFDISDRNMVFEVMEAGKILGIDVRIGIEFSVGKAKKRSYFMFIPPVSGFDDLMDFLNRNEKCLQPFFSGLLENRMRRYKTITEILDEFNKTHRIRMNERYREGSLFALDALKMEDLEKIVSHGQYSRAHLGELLLSKWKPILKRRTLALKSQYEIYRKLFSQGKITEWELERIEDAYESIREQYRVVTADALREACFSDKNIVDYDSAFTNVGDILPLLKTTGGEILFLSPLKQGFPDAVSSLIQAFPYIDGIELINMRDNARGNPSEIIQLADFTDLMNNRKITELLSFLEDLRIEVDQDMIICAHQRFHENPLVPVAGSAATGWKPYVPGMGFIRLSAISRNMRKHFSKTHYRLPHQVSSLILSKGLRRDESRSSDPKQDIVSLGHKGTFQPNLVGDEEKIEKIDVKRFWRYLNPTLKNIIRVLIGVIPAYLWFGPLYTAVWFGITFFRNVFVDFVALSGSIPGRWSIRDVNFDNVTQSLFWTGFSVPILGLVKIGFDAAWPFSMDVAVFEWSKFFVICIANGTYISIHNKIRNFDSRVIRANFFRSVFAWPLAAMFAAVGNFLGIPSIVQAKFWSDVVAAFIEGIGKYRHKIVLRKRDLLEILPRLKSSDRNVRMTAMLDILYIWAKRHRGRTSLKKILKNGRGFSVAEKENAFSPEKLENKSENHPMTNENTEKGEKNGISPVDTDYRFLFIRLFNPARSHTSLQEFIFQHFGDREAQLLLDLVNHHLVPFHTWLERGK